MVYLSTFGGGRLPVRPRALPAQEAVSVTEVPGGQARARAFLIRGPRLSPGAVRLAGPLFKARRVGPEE